MDDNDPGHARGHEPEMVAQILALFPADRPFPLLEAPASERGN